MRFSRSTGHNVVGHSTRGSDELIAGDLDRPSGAAAHLGHGARAARRARSTCSSTMPASTKASPTNAADDEWHAAWARTHDHQPAIGGRPLPPRGLALPRPRRRRPDRQHRQPRRLSRRFARSTGIMPRPRPAMIGMTKSIARGYAAEDILCFAVAPGFTVSEMTDGISRRAAAARRSSPTSRSAGSPAPTRSPR